MITAIKERVMAVAFGLLIAVVGLISPKTAWTTLKDSTRGMK